jgi:hypothetical protein
MLRLVRVIAALSLVLAAWIADPGAASSQERPRHHVGAIEGGEWESWRGRPEAYLAEQLGAPDRVVGARRHYDYVTVGSYEGPYRIFELTFVVRQGRVASVRAVFVAGVGCDLEE